MNMTRADERASSSTYQASHILSGLCYTVTNTLTPVYPLYHLQTILLHSTTVTRTSPPCSGRQLTSTYVRIYNPHATPCTNCVVQLSSYRALSHVFLSYTVYSIVITFATKHVDGSSAAVALVSSSQYCSLADVLLSTKSDRATVQLLCTPNSVLLNHVLDVLRQQNVHNR